MTRPFLSVIIPCYNEAARLPLTLIDVDRHLAGQDFSSEIIVVVSRSADETQDIVKRFQAIIKNLRGIYLSENLGRGHAVRTGMLGARGEWRLVMDADNSTTIAELAKMLPLVTAPEHQCEIAIGSRFAPGAQTDPPEPTRRRLVSRIGQFFTRALLLKGITDAGCGFKLFSGPATDTIFKRTQTNGWSLDTESLVIAQQQGYKIHEVPIFWAYDPGTHRSSHSIFRVIKEHGGILIRKWTGSYKNGASKSPLPKNQ